MVWRSGKEELYTKISGIFTTNKKVSLFLSRSHSLEGHILCWFGLYRWGKKFGYDLQQSNIIDWKARCERCGKLKKWVAPKDEDYGRRR
jgi:hypothetical protein